MFERAKEIMEAVGKNRSAIDGLWYWSVNDLERSLPALRADPDLFARARRALLHEWSESKAPTAREGASAAVELVGDTARYWSWRATLRRLRSKLRGIDRIGGSSAEYDTKGTLGPGETQKDIEELT